MIHSAIWKALFSLMQWIDWASLAAVFVGIFYGFKKGFWKVFFDLIRIVAVIVLTLELEGKVSGYLGVNLRFIPSDFLPMIGFAVTAVATWFVVTFIIRGIRDLFVTKSSSFARLIGGLGLGSLYGFICLSFFVRFLMVTPWPSIKTAVAEGASYTGHYLADTAPEIHSLVMQQVKRFVQFVQQTRQPH